jgi:hypothetical protein
LKILPFLTLFLLATSAWPQSNPVAAHISVGHAAAVEVRARTMRANPLIASQVPGGFIIIPTFDSTIASNPNALAIENSIYAAIAIYESLFTDPVAVSIYFSYSSTLPDGTTATDLGNSFTSHYDGPCASYISVLQASSSTIYDSAALMNLRGTPLATEAIVASALGRALGIDMPGLVGPDGKGSGTFDGFVNINPNRPLEFNRNRVGSQRAEGGKTGGVRRDRIAV